jgi:acetylornithine deacetylase/succinyl-diaminopimelate desuccinylase-like protein
MAPFYPGQLGADMKAVVANPNDEAVVARLSAAPQYNAQLRTTCVATMLSGGHAENALPQSATAVINCRLLPVDKPEEVERTLNQVLADPKIKVSVMTPAKPVAYKPIDPKLLSVVTEATNKSWPGLSVIPQMSSGASDGIHLITAGIPTYGISGIFGDEDDVRAHGRDERVLVKSFDEAVDFMYTVVAALGKSQ